MAARRRSTSPGSRSRSPRRAASSGSNPVPMIIGAGVVVVVILIAVATSGGGDDPNPAQAATRTDPAPATQPDPTPAKKRSSAPKRHLEDPDRPAPQLPDAVMSAAETAFEQAKKLHVDARKAQAAGDHARFNALINDSWDALSALYQKLEPYTTWLEEADMESWKVPASYSRLLRFIEKYDRERGKIKRIKPNRR